MIDDDKLVERLRDAADGGDAPMHRDYEEIRDAVIASCLPVIKQHALDALLREALEPFARAAADQIEGHEPDNCDIWEHGLSVAVTFGDFRRAATAFAALKGERP